jgi:aspartate/methionine/tyrosine aminotransferase
VISTRATSLINNPSPIVEGHLKCVADPFSKSNPQGHLNFGIAQNHLMQEETVDFVLKNHSFQAADIHYNDGHGKYALRDAFATFAKNFLGIKDINPQAVTVQNGVSAICESLAFCLFNEGDTLLMPAPYYPGFAYDFSMRFKVHIETVELKSAKNFKHSFEDFAKRIHEVSPKAILLTHPYNPTGESLTSDFYQPLIKLCQQKNIHIISDEIYALTRLSGEKHQSLFNFDYENIHLLYGLAKDFTLAGLKMGFFYTRNEKLATAMQAVSYFHTTSTQTQNSITQLFLDKPFIQTFMLTNQQRIKKTYEYITASLPQLKHVKPDAGIFFLADFRSKLKQQTLEAEKELFHYFINELKINMTPGYAMGMREFGFFRVCYAKSEVELTEFVNRLQKIIT